MGGIAIPDVINVLGLEYEVVIEPLDGEDGSIDPRAQRITIDSRITPARMEQTFVHEVLHAVFDQIGREDLYGDERLVQTLAVALHQTLLDPSACG